jgi:hypothetical protein
MKGEELTNEDLWLCILMKKGKIAGEDINKFVGELRDKDEVNISRVCEIYDIAPPSFLKGANFRYKLGKRKEKLHNAYHLILRDLDHLCSTGMAQRVFEEDEETGDIAEEFKITPLGASRVVSLYVDTGER